MNLHYKFGSKNLMSVIVHLCTVSNDSCNDEAETSENQICVCVKF